MMFARLKSKMRYLFSILIFAFLTSTFQNCGQMTTPKLDEPQSIVLGSQENIASQPPPADIVPETLGGIGPPSASYYLYIVLNPDPSNIGPLWAFDGIVTDKTTSLPVPLNKTGVVNYMLRNDVPYSVPANIYDPPHGRFSFYASSRYLKGIDIDFAPDEHN